MKRISVESIRDAALLRSPTTPEDLRCLLEIADRFDDRLLGFIWASIAYKILMSALPSFENLSTYNARRRAVERVIEDQGFAGKLGFSTIDDLVELGSRLADYRSGARKASWADLHYKTRKEILVSQNHRCIVCGVGLRLGDPGHDHSPELDHIVPFALRGNIESNTRVICKRCNLAKLDHLTYVTQGRLAHNDLSRLDLQNMFRLLYWAAEIANSRCENQGCQNTSHSHRLHLVRRHSLVGWTIDNVSVYCEDCSGQTRRFPS